MTSRETRSHRRLLTVALSVGALFASLLGAPPPAAVAAAVQTIYMSPSGSDSLDGASPSRAVATLQRVQDIIRDTPAANANTSVEVRIAAGTYESAPITWYTYRPGHTISFMPIDYVEGQGRASVASLPIFVNKRAAASGRYLTGSWFTGCLPSIASGRPLARGGDGGLRFYYLQVENYANAGISLNGSNGCMSYSASSGPGAPSARGLNGNTVFGMVFTRLGNQYTGGTCDSETFNRCGYGAIVLTESSHNRIANNHFTDLRNTELSYIHAIYMTHKSSHNTFTGNRVTGVSSGPVKVRDASNYNTIERNVFGANDFNRRSTPGATHYLEEVSAGECSSYHNRFAYNDLGNILYGEGQLRAWQLVPDGATYAGPPGCPAIPSGETRLITAGNYY